ncbi:MAG TPA: esterase-like activity of phytase family protein, partial [Epsilonproteobacteria bacterium]|nr:esterase-like activity of phytase family protein [Campylobacterota bacterium]
LAKVGKHRYIMVSDDNDNFMQKTLLVYFEVIE